MSKLKQHFRVPFFSMDKYGRANRKNDYRVFLDRIEQAISEENRNIKLDPLDGYMRIATYIHIALDNLEEAYRFISDTDMLCLKKAGYDPYKAARLSKQVQMLAFAENNPVDLHPSLICLYEGYDPEKYGDEVPSEETMKLLHKLYDMLDNIHDTPFADETDDKLFCPYNKKTLSRGRHHSSITEHFNDRDWFVATPEAKGFRKNINSMFPKYWIEENGP